MPPSLLPGGGTLRWVPSPRRRMARLAVVVALHLILFVALWRSVVAAVPTMLVPVSLQMVVPQAATVKPPEPHPLPLPQRVPVPKRIEPPTVQMAEPEVPVVSSVNLPISPPVPPSAPAIAPDTVPASPRIQWPSSTADYLSNPAPAYPPVSKRLQEQGRVLLYVLVDAQGLPVKVELKRSSGFSRLDDVALATVQHWKFVPGQRNGVVEAMWVEVPIEFRLQV